MGSPAPTWGSVQGGNAKSKTPNTSSRASQLRDQCFHAPAASAADAEAILGRDDRAESVELQLEAVIADKKCRFGAGKSIGEDNTGQRLGDRAIDLVESCA
jgi:hypothetical protein